MSTPVVRRDEVEAVPPGGPGDGPSVAVIASPKGPTMLVRWAPGRCSSFPARLPPAQSGLSRTAKAAWGRLLPSRRTGLE